MTLAQNYNLRCIPGSFLLNIIFSFAHMHLWLNGNYISFSLGCGDFSLSSVSSLPDPCPLPDKLKKRSLNEKEKLIYAPMTGVGGIVYDKVSFSV